MDVLYTVLTDWNLVLLLMSAGAVSGLVAGMFGIGGGVVIVPVLYYFSSKIAIMPEYQMQIIIATSLTAIVFSSASSAISHIRYKEVSSRLVYRFVPSMFIGALFGTYLNSMAKGDTLTIVFALFCIFVAIKMALNIQEKPIFKKLPSHVVTSGIGFCIASFSAMIGVGGGTLSVPALTLLNTPFKKAVGTSSVFTAVVALSASISYLVNGLSVQGLPPEQLGYINWVALVFLVPVGMAVAPIGSKIANRLNPRLLRVLFAVMLVISSGKMLFNVLY